MPRPVWKTVSEIKIPVLPESEQIAISTSLFDADVFIRNLENLLYKKLSLKQGAVQKLLQPLSAVSNHKIIMVFISF